MSLASFTILSLTTFSLTVPLKGAACNSRTKFFRLSGVINNSPVFHIRESADGGGSEGESNLPGSTPGESSNLEWVKTRSPIIWGANTRDSTDERWVKTRSPIIRGANTGESTDERWVKMRNRIPEELHRGVH
jgi:hypothetical protein